MKIVKLIFCFLFVLLSVFGFCMGYTLSALPDLPSILLLYHALCSGKLTLRTPFVSVFYYNQPMGDISKRLEVGRQLGQKDNFVVVGVY